FDQRQCQRFAEQCFFYHAAGDIAAGMAAHAVGDEPEIAPLVLAYDVLIGAAAAAWMSATGESFIRSSERHVGELVQKDRCALAAAVANCCGLNVVSFLTALYSESSAAFLLARSP